MPFLTWLILRSSRNFVAAYGLLDFGLILAFSLVVTAPFFLCWKAARKLYEHRKARKIAELTPSTQDTPLTILDKLTKLKQEMLLSQVYFAGGNQAQRLLVLEPWAKADELWLVPPAELQGINPRNYAGLDESDKLVTGQYIDARAVADRVRHGVQQGWWTDLGWRTVGDVRRPVKVQPSGWTRLPHPARLLQGD